MRRPSSVLAVQDRFMAPFSRIRFPALEGVGQAAVGAGVFGADLLPGHAVGPVGQVVGARAAVLGDGVVGEDAGGFVGAWDGRAVGVGVDVVLCGESGAEFRGLGAAVVGQAAAGAGSGVGGVGFVVGVGVSDGRDAGGGYGGTVGRWVSLWRGRSRG